MKLSCVSPISNNGNPTAKFPGSILKINPPVLPVKPCVALFVALLIHTVKAAALRGSVHPGQRCARTPPGFTARTHARGKAKPACQGPRASAPCPRPLSTESWPRRPWPRSHRYLDPQSTGPIWTHSQAKEAKRNPPAPRDAKTKPGKPPPWLSGSFPCAPAQELITGRSPTVPSISLPSLPISFQFIYFSDLNPHLVV